MNQTLPTADLNTAGTTDVIPSVAIDRIIAQRNEGIALFMQAMECLATARRILLDASGDIFLYGFEDCVTDSVRCMDKPEEAKRNITRLADRKIWDRLMTDTGMYTFMSSCQRDEWNSQLMSDTCPEITLDNVLATFRHLNASKMQTFEQGLIDVYRKLSWDYRTNNPCRLGKRIIIENLLYRWSNGVLRWTAADGRHRMTWYVRFICWRGATFLTSGAASGRSTVNLSGTATMSVSC